MAVTSRMVAYVVLYSISAMLDSSEKKSSLATCISGTNSRHRLQEVQ